VTDQTRNVELVIRAKNLTKKTLGDVRKEIDEINKALDDQVEASKKGQGSLKDLGAAYTRLETSMKALLQQQSVVKQFEAQAAQLGKLQEALGAASVKLREHEQTMAATEKVTKRQVQQLTSYQNAVNKTETALAKQAERLSKTRQEGEALGLAMNDLVGAQNQILNTSRQLSATYDKQSVAVNELADNVAAAARQAKAAAETELFEKQATEAARLVKAGEYVNFWVKELEKLEQAEKALATETAAAKAFEKDAQSAAELVRAADYVNFWTKSLDELDATQKRLANSKSLDDLASNAVAAAKGYTTLGDSTSRLVQNNRLLSASIRDILDPSAQVRASLGGVEEEVNALAATIAKINGPVTDYRAQVNQLVAANKTLANQASGIDAYNKQIAALREARAEFSKNRAELLSYAATLRSADEPTAAMQATLKRLEGALAASSASLQKEINTTRELRTGLQQAGVATNDLAGAQARLVSSAQKSAAAMSQLGAAVKRYGTEVENSAESGDVFQSNGRTTLSLLQRIRGEVLALAAAYVGLQGTIGLANDSLEASNTKQGLQNQLALAVGDDPKAIAAEYQYIREQADRIGVSFEEAARGYAKFSAAAKLAGRSNQEIRYVAESFLEVGRVANLSADNIDGVFKALEQIYSKGKIQAEELRGQLGDRLFGAFEIAAIALKDQFPDLDKAMKDGLITSEQLVAIAEQYRKTVANRLPSAMESLAANQQRLNSAFFDFKVLIAESGFADQYEKLIVSISSFFRSDDGKKFAQDLSTAFGAVVSVLTFLLEHLDEVKLAVELAFGLKALSLVAGLAASMTTTLIPALISVRNMLLSTGVAGVTAAATIKRAFLALAAFFAGYQIGTYLADEFEIVRQMAVGLVVGVEKLFTQLKFAIDVVWVGISVGAQNSFTKALNIIKDFSDDTIRLLASVAKSAGQDDFAAKISGYLSDGFREGSKDAQAEVDKLKEQLKKDMGAIDDIGFQMFQDASDAAKNAAGKNKAVLPTDRPASNATGAPSASGGADKAYEKLVNKRIALADQLVRALEAAEAKIQRNEKLSLEQRLAAIDTEYAKVYRKIEALSKLPGGAQVAADMKVTLDGYVKQIKEQETLKFNQEEMARREKAINDLIALRSQLLQTIAAQQKAGTLPENKVKEAMAGVDEQVNPQISSAVQSAREFALANQAAFGDQTALDTYLAKLDAIDAGLVTVSSGLLNVDQINQDIAGGLTNSFDAFGKAIANGEDAIGAFHDAFLTFVADFLKKIALMIIQQIILNALQNSNPYGAAAGAAVGAVNGATSSQKHSGGLIGSGYSGVKVSSNPNWFNGAPKYHDGGVVGLASDEYPAILQRNEEVLAADNPRNVMNGGGDAGSSSQPIVQDVTVNNHVDAESFMAASLATPRGRKLIMNVLSAERTQLKSLVGN